MREMFKIVMAAFVTSLAISHPSVGQELTSKDKIEGKCYAWFMDRAATDSSAMRAKDYVPYCRCMAPQVMAAGMSAAERRLLETKFDPDTMNAIFKRKPEAMQRADACLSAARRR